MSTKLCSHCRVEKPLDRFSKKGKKLQSWCKDCTNTRNRQYYASNVIKHRRVVRSRALRLREINREFIMQYLMTHPCVDCGETDPVVLEFDHVRGSKTASVSRMLAEGASLERIRKEIQKCEVRCANCHRRVTAVRGKSWRIQ